MLQVRSVTQLLIVSKLYLGYSASKSLQKAIQINMCIDESELLEFNLPKVDIADGQIVI